MSELGLDFHQILHRELLWVKDRIALRWVVYAATIQITYLIKGTPSQHKKQTNYIF
jgi:hypothetical protein